METKVQNLISAITELRPELDAMSKVFREGRYSEDSYNFDIYSGNDWRRNVFGNGLIKLKLITEQNFNFVETLGLVSVSRYIFELSIWLLLLSRNKNWGLFYYRRLLDNQLNYYKSTLDQHKNEIKLLQKFDKLDNESTSMTIKQIKAESNLKKEELTELIRNSMQTVDSEAARHFSLYLDDAKKMGYGFQAHLVEKNQIPALTKAVKQIEQAISEYDKNVSKNIKKTLPFKLNWFKLAQKVGLQEEYNYIYSFTSKLLHASPSSLTTDQKNLEIHEMYIFLRYIHVKMKDILELSCAQPEYSINSKPTNYGSVDSNIN